MMVRDLEWVRERTVEISVSGCWIWVNHLNRDGYARINGHPSLAHRLSYALKFGKIIFGREIHHVCSVKCCVNPDHLSSVTPKEHARIETKRGNRKNGNTDKKTCIRGHDFLPENTREEPQKASRSGFVRRCLKCEKMRKLTS